MQTTRPKFCDFFYVCFWRFIFYIGPLLTCPRTKFCDRLCSTAYLPDSYYIIVVNNGSGFRVLTTDTETTSLSRHFAKRQWPADGAWEANTFTIAVTVHTNTVGTSCKKQFYFFFFSLSFRASRLRRDLRRRGTFYHYFCFSQHAAEFTRNNIPSDGVNYYCSHGLRTTKVTTIVV